MGMNIKSERAHDLAKRVARRTGTSITTAVEEALQEKLERLETAANAEAKYKRIRELIDSLPPPPPGVTSDHSDLYDEWGLPK